MLRRFRLHIRTAEMQFDSVSEIRVFSTTRKLFESIFFERVEAAKCNQPFGKKRGLGRIPIIVRLTFEY